MAERNYMKFYIHENTLNNQKSQSGKAIYFTHTFGGFNTGRTHEWFPFSQLKISAFNECGWAEVEIPDWLLNQKGLLGYAGTLKGGFEELEIY